MVCYASLIYCNIICISTRNCNNKFILREKRWPISKCREMEVGLEFEYNGFAKCNNFREGSFKPKKDMYTQVI